MSADPSLHFSASLCGCTTSSALVCQTIARRRTDACQTESSFVFRSFRLAFVWRVPTPDASRARRRRVGQDARAGRPAGRRAAHGAQRATAGVGGGAAARPRALPRAAAPRCGRGCRRGGRPRAARLSTRVSGRHRPIGAGTRCRDARRGDCQRGIATGAARRLTRWHGQRWMAVHMWHGVGPQYGRRERPPRTDTPPDTARPLRKHHFSSSHPHPVPTPYVSLSPSVAPRRLDLVDRPWATAFAIWPPLALPRLARRQAPRGVVVVTVDVGVAASTGEAPRPGLLSPRWR